MGCCLATKGKSIQISPTNQQQQIQKKSKIEAKRSVRICLQRINNWKNVLDFLNYKELMHIGRCCRRFKLIACRPEILVKFFKNQVFSQQNMMKKNRTVSVSITYENHETICISPEKRLMVKNPSMSPRFASDSKLKMIEKDSKTINSNATPDFRDRSNFNSRIHRRDPSHRKGNSSKKYNDDFQSIIENLKEVRLQMIQKESKKKLRYEFCNNEGEFKSEFVRLNLQENTKKSNNREVNTSFNKTIEIRDTPV